PQLPHHRRRPDRGRPGLDRPIGEGQWTVVVRNGRRRRDARRDRQRGAVPARTAMTAALKRPLLLLAAAAAMFFLGGSGSASAGQGVIAESPGCGYPRFYLPDAGRRGSLPDSFPVRGPAGALFGRTLGAVRSQLVWWQVPMSDGVRVRVHRKLLPVLAEVRANLAEAATRGLTYRVRSSDTWGFNARTSVAHSAISYHGLGAAIDINATTNPYRRDGRLITDM